MAEMTLLEAARDFEGNGGHAVERLAKAARTVMQHAGDMKKLDQECLARETDLDEIKKKIESVNASEVEESNVRAARLTAALEEDQQILISSKVEIKPALEKLAEIKEQTEVAEGRLSYTLSENDRIVTENKRDLKQAQDRLTEVQEAIRITKAHIGAL